MDRPPRTTLQDILTNSLILRQTTPHLPLRTLLALAATSKSLRLTLTNPNNKPDIYRYLDLSTLPSPATASIESTPIDVGGISWRAERMDESLTEDDFHSGPLRGIFSHLQRQSILSNVQTLVLDGLSVPADLVREVLTEERYQVRILSMRGVRNLNEGRLQQVLRYVVRPTRAEGGLRLRGLYVFGSREPVGLRVGGQRQQQQGWEDGGGLGVMAAEGAQIGARWEGERLTGKTGSVDCGDEEGKWYHSTGRVLKRLQSDWPDTLAACKGIIAFDAVLCRGPRHDIAKTTSKEFLQATIATVALGPTGCEICHSCPEGSAVFGKSSEDMLPLLGPAPLQASTVRAAQYPNPQYHDENGSMPRLILRCDDCLRGRWCESCNRWWCEDCYEEPVSRLHQRTELQQIETRTELQRNGWMGGVEGGPAAGAGTAVKVYNHLCVERCLVSEMMSGAGSAGMWG
ncbi:hypothetical protein LTR62_008395 [Meristemomyces frigidus]|uniref:Ubiquitin fusion degradation protein n=1 Tax=Meristemomyces frigidus TaxID=1508187 RepID=A0AAN7YCQ4_9PEZI|nr:hypothetical protein LTR62_008395 [Meristemomyces frigidus]